MDDVGHTGGAVMAWRHTVAVTSPRGGTVKISFKTEGYSFEEIAAGVANLGYLPTSIVSSSSKKAATRIKRAARGIAPKRTGLLRSAIEVSRRKERSKTKGKAVWDVWISSAYNSQFQKPSSGQRNGYAYVPASMNYGFTLKNGQHYDGFYYMESAAEALSEVHEEMTLSDAQAALNRLWARKQKAANGGE